MDGQKIFKLDGQKKLTILMMGKWIIKHPFRLVINGFEKLNPIHQVNHYGKYKRN
jgi:hypothetical protein